MALDDSLRRHVMLNVDENTFYRLVHQGKLSGYKVAGFFRFQIRDTQAWISEQKQKAIDKTIASRPLAVRKIKT